MRKNRDPYNRMKNFDNNFNQSRSRFNMIFGIMIAVFVIMFVGSIVFYGWIGTKIVNEVNSEDNNGSIAKTLGHFYKDFKSASNEPESNDL